MSTTTTKTTQLALDQQMIAGIKKHGTTVASWVIAGKTYTAQQALDILQARVDAALAVAPAKAGYRSTVQAANTEIATTKQFVSGLRQATYVMFSSQPDILGDFGLVPHKTRTVPTALEKVQAVEQRKATRAIRHTMGKTEKAKLKGTANVTVTVTTPPTSAPTPAQSVALATNPHGPGTQGS